MDTGIEELQVPPLDPMFIKEIDYTFFNMTLKSIDLYMRGFKRFKLEKSEVNKEER